MLFNELRFFAFYLVAFAVYWGLRSNGPRKWWLLLCSLVFYGAWDWRFVGLMLTPALIDFFVALRLETPGMGPGRRKAWLLVSVMTNLALLGLFKYYNFFVESAAQLLDAIGLHTSPRVLNVILPVGISFYTFQSLSYTIDVYRRQLAAVRSVRDFALFVAFFPQLVAGPIVRARDFLPQLERARRWADVDVRWALGLFLVGFVKKAIVSDNVAVVTDLVFGNPEAYGPADKWLATGLYGAQIYCDFSGYTDMALGTAGLLGYQLCLNFNFPYFSVSLTDFWRRWHVSMTSWFRDYVYISLGGNRGGLVRTSFNLLATFFLAGLWHGASWNFIFFGLMNGVFLVIERWANHRGVFDPFKPRWWGRAYVLWEIAMSFVLFRTADLPQAWHFFLDMHGLRSGAAAAASIDPRWWLAVLAFGFGHWLMWKKVPQRLFAGRSDWTVAAALGTATALLLPLLPAGYKPFIYFQF